MNQNRRTFLKTSVAAGTAAAVAPLAVTEAKAAGKGARHAGGGPREGQAQRVIAEQAMLGDGEGIGLFVQAGGAGGIALVKLCQALAERSGGHPALADIHMGGDTQGLGIGLG